MVVYTWMVSQEPNTYLVALGFMGFLLFISRIQYGYQKGRLAEEVQSWRSQYTITANQYENLTSNLRNTEVALTKRCAAAETKVEALTEYNKQLGEALRGLHGQVPLPLPGYADQLIEKPFRSHG